AVEEGSSTTGASIGAASSQADNPVAAHVVDATVLALCSYDTLMKLVDLKKVRAMLEREVDRAGEGCVHLTPLFVYLWALAKPWYATGDVIACVREIVSALQERGVRMRLPDTDRFPALSRETTTAPGKSSSAE